MRDVVGSSFMFRILIIFIVMFIVFMCFTVAYAKTFRLKNRVIDILEQSQYQGYIDTERSDWDDIALGTVDDYLASNAYDYPGGDHAQISNHCANVGGNLTGNGACIVNKDAGNNSRYYQVYVYICFWFPLFNWEIVMPVGGETDVIPVIE